jgi:hypothetical protein
MAVSGARGSPLRVGYCRLHKAEIGQQWTVDTGA